MLRLASLFRRRQRQIWLHIGLPKCGSTSLQRHMAEAYEAHAARGVCYPQAWRQPDGYRNHLPLAQLPPQALPAALADIAAEAESLSCRRIVLSCEHWANAFPNSNLLALCSALQQELPDWQVRIAAYFRNPYDFVESAYAQYVRAGLFQISRHRFYADGAPSLAKFLQGFRSSRGFELYSSLSYARMLAAHFPPEMLSLRSVEPQDLAPGGMLADFTRLLDLPPPPDSARRNRRVSNRKLAELEYVQTLVDQDSYARMRQQLLDTRFGPAGPGTAEADNRRGTTLHIGPELAAAITRQIQSERSALQQLFDTGTGGLCEVRSGSWDCSELLSDGDRAELHSFVARQSG